MTAYLFPGKSSTTVYALAYRGLPAGVSIRHHHLYLQSVVFLHLSPTQLQGFAVF